MSSEARSVVDYRHSGSVENRYGTTVFEPCESCERTPLSELLVVSIGGRDFLTCAGCAAFAVLSAEMLPTVGDVIVARRSGGRVLV